MLRVDAELADEVQRFHHLRIVHDAPEPPPSEKFQKRRVRRRRFPGREPDRAGDAFQLVAPKRCTGRFVHVGRRRRRDLFPDLLELLRHAARVYQNRVVRANAKSRIDLARDGIRRPCRRNWKSLFVEERTAA